MSAVKKAAAAASASAGMGTPSGSESNASSAASAATGMDVNILAALLGQAMAAGVASTQSTSAKKSEDFQKRRLSAKSFGQDVSLGMARFDGTALAFAAWEAALQPNISKICSNVAEYLMHMGELEPDELSPLEREREGLDPAAGGAKLETIQLCRWVSMAMADTVISQLLVGEAADSVVISRSEMGKEEPQFFALLAMLGEAANAWPVKLQLVNSYRSMRQDTAKPSEFIGRMQTARMPVAKPFGETLVRLWTLLWGALDRELVGYLTTVKGHFGKMPMDDKECLAAIVAIANDGDVWWATSGRTRRATQPAAAAAAISAVATAAAAISAVATAATAKADVVPAAVTAAAAAAVARTNNNTTAVCWNCQKAGHAVRNCEKKRNEEEIRRNREIFMNNKSSSVSNCFPCFHSSSAAAVAPAGDRFLFVDVRLARGKGSKPIAAAIDTGSNVNMVRASLVPAGAKRRLWTRGPISAWDSSQRTPPMATVLLPCWVVGGLPPTMVEFAVVADTVRWPVLLGIGAATSLNLTLDCARGVVRLAGRHVGGRRDETVSMTTAGLAATADWIDGVVASWPASVRASGRQLLQRHATVFVDQELVPPSSLPEVAFRVTGLPVQSRRRTLNPIKQAALAEYVEALLKAGLIEPGSGPFRSEPHLVAEQKEDGSTKIRFTIDYSTVNTRIEENARAMPSVRLSIL